MDVRIESDSMGDVPVPADRYWGAQTQRSLQNFRIGHDHFPREMIRNTVMLKRQESRDMEDLTEQERVDIYLDTV